MVIGIDATSWLNRRGYGRFVRNVVAAAVADPSNQHRWVAVFDSDPPGDLPTGLETRSAHAGRPTVETATALSRRSLGDMWRVSRALTSRDFDVVVFPTVYSYVPVMRRVPVLVFFHDAIAETYSDLAHPNRRARRLWNLKVRLARAQATEVGTVSEYSADRLAPILGIARERFHVVTEAAAPAFRVLQPTPAPNRVGDVELQTGRRWLAYVGGFGPHKNLERLLDAFATIAAAHPDVDLLMVGGPTSGGFHNQRERLVARSHELSLGERVRFTGFVDDDRLAELLNVATALVLPSLAEGFGLPAVEAAACGCPVIATTESPLPQLLDGGGLFVDPLDGVALGAALDRVLGSTALRDELASGALQAARTLTWERAGRQLVAAIEATVAT